MSTEDTAPSEPMNPTAAPEQHPAPGAAGDLAADTSSARTAPSAPGRPRPRTGPIVWGCLLLAFCAYIAQRTFAPNTVDNAFWVTGTLFGLGGLLLAVGIAIAIRNSRDR